MWSSKNYWLKKPDSRKLNSPFFPAKAECNLDNCKVYTFNIADEAVQIGQDISEEMCQQTNKQAHTNTTLNRPAAEGLLTIRFHLRLLLGVLPTV